jgi:hypothetical protein
MPILGVIASSRQGSLSGYVSLATYTCTGGESAVTFSAISQAYQHLEIRYVGRDTSANGGYKWLWTRFNNDSSANYSYMFYGSTGSLTALGGTVANNQAYGGTVPEGGQTAGVFSGGWMRISNYTSTSTYKGFKAQGGWVTAGDAGTVHDFVGGLWNSQNAVTRLDFSPQSSTWAAGSTFAIYGIK